MSQIRPSGGYRKLATSSQTELRLVNVARASLDELLLDDEDWLRHRHLDQWAADASEALAGRQVPQKYRSDPRDHIPSCPQCGKAMVLRTAHAGKNAGKQFWGCSGYPDCEGVVNI